MPMKKIISVCIIFVFLWIPFTGCGKLKDSSVSGLNQSETSNEAKIPQQVETSEAPKLSQISKSAKSTQETKLTSPAQASEPLNILNKDNALVPFNNSMASDVAQCPDNSSQIGIKDLTKKESWKEWTGRQWTDNKWYWIGGAVVVVVAATGLYYGYNELAYLKFTRDLNKYQALQSAYNKSMTCVLNKEIFKSVFECPFREGIAEMRLFWNGADKRGKLVAQKGFEHIWYQVQKNNPRAFTNSFLKVAIIRSGGILPNSQRLSDDFT
jgi:hypothetical protein